jgi:hypothetical protein
LLDLMALGVEDVLDPGRLPIPGRVQLEAARLRRPPPGRAPDLEA